MLSGEDTAMIHDRAVGCTFESAPYPVSINGKRYTMWDTAGLNEGSAGSVPADQALLHLRTLVDKLEAGVSLLVYCIRGERYRNITKVNYDLFTQIICQGEVPVVVVVTGLENENRMEDWWEVNANQFSARGLHFDGHACVTTSKGKENGFEKEYQESKRTVSTLINDLCPGTAWVVDSELWFARIAKHTQEYWENYNGSSHHTRRLKGEREAEETQRLFGVGRFLHSLAQKISTLLVDRHS
jgi:predicted GTPase